MRDKQNELDDPQQPIGTLVKDTNQIDWVIAVASHGDFPQVVWEPGCVEAAEAGFSQKDVSRVQFWPAQDVQYTLPTRPDFRQIILVR